RPHGTCDLRVNTPFRSTHAIIDLEDSHEHHRCHLARSQNRTASHEALARPRYPARATRTRTPAENGSSGLPIVGVVRRSRTPRQPGYFTARATRTPRPGHAAGVM